MCGIVGIYAFGRDAAPVSRAELARVRDSMAVRGPDGVGEWFGEDGRAALGHRRLAIIDLSAAAAQPMASFTGESIISFNGEIYNYKELREELMQKGQQFRTHSDTEVILALYEREGIAMLSRLRGMFTAIIWDQRRRGMLLARDPMGIKPLYYTEDGGTVRVASQVRALLAGGVDASVDPAGCVSFFVLGYVAEPFTIRRRIRALPAGHSLWIDAAGIGEPRPFHSVRDVLYEAEQSSGRGSGTASRELIGRSIKASIAAHMVADVPVGLFLSAGLDSTGIASVARDYTSKPLRTLTLGFHEYRGTEQDEVPIAEEVARTFGTDHETLWVKGRDFLAERDHLLKAMDQPTIDGANAYFVSRAAAQSGLKVALCGLGGDELFGGYPGYAQVPRISRILRPFRLFPALGRAFRAASSRALGHVTSPKYAGLLEYGTSFESAYLLRRALYMPWELPDVLDPELARIGWSELDLLGRLRETTAGLRGDRTRMAALEMTWYMRNQLLRDADWAGMAHSVEIRTPLVDVDLLRELAPLLSGSAPPSKQTMIQSTPAGRIDAVVRRRKTGFTVPVREWLINSVGQPAGDRGLRGWAKFVFRHHLPHLGALDRDYVSHVGPTEVRILHVIADLDHRKGGPTAACLGMARLMARRGHHVRIITTDRGYVPEPLDRGCVVEIEALPGSWPAFFGTSWAMRRRLTEVIPEVDVVHLHSLYLFHDWATGRACCSCEKPYIVRPHGTLDPFIYRRHRWRKALADALFQNAVLRRAAGLHFTAREEWELARPHALNRHGCIIPIGIDLGPYAELPPRATLRARYPAIGNRKVMLFLGRLSFKKGVDIAIAAFAEATRGRDDAFLIVAGPDDGVRADAEARIVDDNLAERVLFTGMITGEDKRVVLAGSDIFLLPSQSENFGISVVEAAACGIPVVISDRVNLWRDFHDAEAGLIAPPVVGAFAAHLRAMLDNPSEATRMGQRGAELVRRRFNWEALATEYEAMYALAARVKALPELA